MAEAVKDLNWEDYREWLFNNKSQLNAKYTFKDSKKYHHLAFSDELVSMKPSRKRQDILKGISNITRYLDIKKDTDFHELWLKWLKKKEIRWRMNPKTDTYLLANQIRMEDVLKNIRGLPEKYKIFATFVLVSGLRTSEAIEAFNNHDKICREGVMELFWDRGTKKANAVYCHPILHDKMKYKTSASRVTKNLHSKYLGCEVRYLRKLNYTFNATKIDPLLAEFMQGRRGNVSQRHYFLPMMSNHRRKWKSVWLKVLKDLV
ncbi:hypothetical protein NSED_07890 [Candidatus Nitrosopumilus sediminis]|uniref:Integrase SSV1 C-terminal domain-containing protein n=2 Tax=Candidatus Nitrosopumilus sediminis TaxID=1229909 RepID=K0BEB6_9ARCH|nr:hypothetical protein NSED_07890 [Candidatus Nitrosopumilus sediminis]